MFELACKEMKVNVQNLIKQHLTIKTDDYEAFVESQKIDSKLCKFFKKLKVFVLLCQEKALSTIYLEKPLILFGYFQFRWVIDFFSLLGFELNKSTNTLELFEFPPDYVCQYAEKALNNFIQKTQIPFKLIQPWIKVELPTQNQNRIHSQFLAIIDEIEYKFTHFVKHEVNHHYCLFLHISSVLSSFHSILQKLYFKHARSKQSKSVSGSGVNLTNGRAYIYVGKHEKVLKFSKIIGLMQMLQIEFDINDQTIFLRKKKFSLVKSTLTRAIITARQYFKFYYYMAFGKYSAFIDQQDMVPYSNLTMETACNELQITCKAICETQTQVEYIDTSRHHHHHNDNGNLSPSAHKLNCNNCCAFVVSFVFVFCGN